jgi:hypothetical protein
VGGTSDTGGAADKGGQDGEVGEFGVDSRFGDYGVGGQAGTSTAVSIFDTGGPAAKVVWKMDTVRKVVSCKRGEKEGG